MLLLGTLAGLQTLTPARAAASAAPLEPATGALLGAYVEPRTGWTRADTEASVAATETAMGRPLDIDQHFYPWASTFPTWREPWDHQNGRIPFVTWGSTFTSDVNSGSQDALIASRADGVRALGIPILLRWFGEMDATALANRTGTPAEFIASWRRIHGIFDEHGATNVDWVWCPTSYGFDVDRAPAYYPGDAYVDWICADGYNWAPRRSGAAWTGFQQIFKAFYEWGAPTGKPLMVGETGTEERNPGEKALWIAQTGAAMKSVYPRIKALVYFDAKEPDFSGPEEFDWRIDTSTSSLEAFRALGSDPYFRQGAPEPVPDPVIARWLDVAVVNGASTIRLAPGGRGSLMIRLRNLGSSADTLRVQGPPGGRRLRVRYLDDGQDVTDEVVAGTHLVHEAAGGSHLLNVRVRVSSRARPGSKRVLRFEVISANDPATADSTRARVRIASR